MKVFFVCDLLYNRSEKKQSGFTMIHQRLPFLRFLKGGRGVLNALCPVQNFKFDGEIKTEAFVCGGCP